MNQNHRFCIVPGHEEYPVFHICTLLECGLTTRWCCPECIQQGIHHHNKADNSHVMNRKGFLTKLMKEYEKFRKDFSGNQRTSSSYLLENILNQCQMLEKNLIDYMQYIEKQIKIMTSDEDQARFEEYLSYLNDNKSEQLDDDKINQLLNISQQHGKEFLQWPFDNIKQQLNQIESIIKDYQDNQNDNSQQIVDLKNRKYITQKIDQTNNYYYGSSISKNEQFLAYCGNDKLLKIFDIKLNRIIKEIKYNYNIYVCQFTKDSSQLYIGLEEGYVNGYEIQADFKEIFRQKIHSSDINNIITIQNEYLITCSDDKSIIKTEVKSKQQKFKLIGHTDRILALDYNDKNEIIVSGSGDKCIKLWNQSIIINKEQSHHNGIRQIQFINNNLHILSLDFDGNLYQWKLDLINKDLIKLQQFSDQNKIFNFYYVNQDQNILLICNNYVKILNQQGEIVNQIEHDGKDSTYYDCRQLQSSNLFNNYQEQFECMLEKLVIQLIAIFEYIDSLKNPVLRQQRGLFELQQQFENFKVKIQNFTVLCSKFKINLIDVIEDGSINIPKQ